MPFTAVDFTSAMMPSTTAGMKGMIRKKLSIPQIKLATADLLVLGGAGAGIVSGFAADRPQAGLVSHRSYNNSFL